MHPKIPHSNNSHSNLPHSLYHYNLRKLSYSYFPSCYLIRRTSQTQKDYCYHQKSKYVAYLLTCHQTNHYFIIGLILTFTIFPTNQQFQCTYVVRSLRGKKNTPMFLQDKEFGAVIIASQRRSMGQFGHEYFSLYIDNTYFLILKGLW